MQPGLIVEVAFVADPYGTLTWTDITDRVLGGSCTRGRNYELGRTSPGTLNLTVKNNDGALDPLNAASAYAPYVLPYRPIRVRCPYTFTATSTTTNASTTVTTTGMTADHTGFTVTGTGIPANTTITYVNATTVTLSNAATATGTVTLTYTFTYSVWRGFVERWPQAWSLGGAFGQVNLIAVDGMKALLGRVFGLPYDQRVQQDFAVTGDVNACYGYWTLDSYVGSTVLAAETGVYSASGSTPQAMTLTTGGSYASVAGQANNGIQVTAGGLSVNTSGAPQASVQAGEFLVRVDATPSPIAGTIQWLICPADSSNSPFLRTPSIGDGLMPVNYVANAGSKPGLSSFGVAMGWWKPLANVITAANVSEMSTDASGWVRNDSAGQALPARDATQPAPQNGPSTSLKLTGAGAGSSVWGATTAAFVTGITAGHVYGFNVRAARGANADLTAVLQIDWYTSGGALISSSASAVTTIRQQSASNYFWSSVAFSATAPATATKCKLQFKTGGGASNLASGVSVWMTAAMLYDITAANSTISGLPGTPTFPTAGDIAYTQPADTTVRFFAYYPGVTPTTDNVYQTLTTALPSLTVSQWYAFTWAAPAATGSAGTAFAQFVPVGGGTTIDIGALLTNTVNVTTSGVGGVTTWGGTANNLQVTYDEIYLARWGYTSTAAPNVNNPSPTYAAAHALYVSHSQTFVSQTADARISAVLDSLSWPAADRTLDVSATTVTASGTVTGTAALQLVQDAADSDLGNVFINGAGKFVFQNRAHRNSGTVKATFGEHSGEYPYRGDLTIDFDPTYLFNDVTITGTVASASYSVNKQDATSQTSYGPWSLPTRSLPLAVKADVDGQAATLVAWYKDPRARVPQVTLSARKGGTPGNVLQMLGREIGDLVTVKRRPISAPAISLNCWIDGITHTWSGDTFDTTFMLTPQFPNSTY